MHEQIINLILVSGGARSSFLFETANLEGDKKRIQKVFDAVDELNLSLTKPLKYTVDDSGFPRYFIYLTVKCQKHNRGFFIPNFLKFLRIFPQLRISRTVYRYRPFVLY